MDTINDELLARYVDGVATRSGLSSPKSRRIREYLVYDGFG